MKAIDEIIYEALKADEQLTTATNGRVMSTCIEVPPTDADKTPLPYIIVTDDGFQNQDTTKDYLWEGVEDSVQASIEISAESPKEVKRLADLCRKAVTAHIVEMANQGEDIPYLANLSGNGVAWDWTKPCYYTTIKYNCTINVDNYEQDDEE